MLDIKLWAPASDDMPEYCTIISVTSTNDQEIPPELNVLLQFHGGTYNTKTSRYEFSNSIDAFNAINELKLRSYCA